jgi:tRNA pseudouridine55 synthase
MTRRARRKRSDRPGPGGFLVVDKPVGWTSHEVVDAARRWLGTRRVGHLGTLDPLATGILPLAIREATKLVRFVAQGSRVYVGSIRLGVATDTFDAEGRVLYRHDGPLPSEEAVRAGLASFRGESMQVPPMFSSVKKDGVPLYRLARRGEVVERAARPIRIHSLAMHHYVPPEIGIEICCSSGTYVRTLASDLGERLGCGAHLSGLRRTASGPFLLEHAAAIEDLEAAGEREICERWLIAPERMLGLPLVELKVDQARRVAHGGDVPVGEASGPFESGTPPRPGDRLAAMAPSGRLLAVMELRPDRHLHPLRVLAAQERL